MTHKLKSETKKIADPFPYQWCLNPKAKTWRDINLIFKHHHIKSFIFPFISISQKSLCVSEWLRIEPKWSLADQILRLAQNNLSLQGRRELGTCSRSILRDRKKKVVRLAGKFGLQSMGLHRVRQDWMTNTFTFSLFTLKLPVQLSFSLSLCLGLNTHRKYEEYF